MFLDRYADVFNGDASWHAIETAGGETYAWDDSSTYVQNPPYFEGINQRPTAITDIEGARILGLFGDKITTDHISPAGSIKPASPAGKYLLEHNVRRRRLQPVRHAARQPRSDDARHLRQHPHQELHGERCRRQREGGRPHVHYPSGEAMSIFDAAMRYQDEGVPLVVFAGIEYGNGSSRDWAAKGTKLLGVRAVIAQSFERIHRSNLVGMGIVPFVFEEGTSWQTLGLKGDETVTIPGLTTIQPRQMMTAEIVSADGTVRKVPILCRIDTLDELEYFKNGGILHYVLRNLAAA